ncbi:uncharacterized protein A4U43_C07F2700 [Asparagus officinalis]|uniref:Uncharacterized protein n=1 Tax=Asparagus officinalis TaxID=4686 RepID=A0A5P1E8Z8_ASPOF|nr:uncharacterized protein A4U43_C07F2700 [Asparagus officinalis]
MNSSSSRRKLAILAENRIAARCTVRETGATAGRKDWCYIDTKTKKRYRSCIEALRALEEELQQEKSISDAAATSETMAAGAREVEPKNSTWMFSGPDSNELFFKDNDTIESCRMNQKRREKKREKKRHSEEELPVGFV